MYFPLMAILQGRHILKKRTKPDPSPKHEGQGQADNSAGNNTASSTNSTDGCRTSPTSSTIYTGSNSTRSNGINDIALQRQPPCSLDKTSATTAKYALHPVMNGKDWKDRFRNLCQEGASDKDLEWRFVFYDGEHTHPVLVLPRCFLPDLGDSQLPCLVCASNPSAVFADVYLCLEPRLTWHWTIWGRWQWRLGRDWRNKFFLPHELVDQEARHDPKMLTLSRDPAKKTQPVLYRLKWTKQTFLGISTPLSLNKADLWSYTADMSENPRITKQSIQHVKEELNRLECLWQIV